MKLSTDWSAYAPTRTLNDLTLWLETDRKKRPTSCDERLAEELLRLQKEPAEAVGGETLMSPSWLGNIGKCPTGGGGWVSLLTLPPCHPGGWEKMSEHCLLQNQDHENKSVCLGIFQLQAKGANL